MKSPKFRVLDEDIFNYLSFRDLVDAKEYANKDWITVARLDDFSLPDSHGVFSILSDEKNKETILKTSEWDVRLDSGHPRFDYKEDNVVFFAGPQQVGKVTFENFVFYRQPVGNYGSQIEILQNFILYHDLRNRPDGNFVEPTNSDVIIKVLNPKHMQVRADFLKDYLAARRMILIRLMDSRRKSDRRIESIISKTRHTLSVRNKDRNYTMVMAGYSGHTKTISIMIGKDVVTPYREPRNAQYLELSGKSKEQFASFITGLNNNGKQEEESCDHSKAPLKLAFFKKQVLDKYYNVHDTYTITDGNVVYKNNDWYIPFDINEEELVLVWLKDLGMLPYAEQLYWKSFNVLPNGKMTNSFFRTQLMAEFADTNDPSARLLNLYREVNSQFENKFGFRLFRELSPEDEYVYKSIRRLLLEQQAEFDSQILYLSKLFVDSLNKADIEKNTKWVPTKPLENASINYLQHFLDEKRITNPTETSQICTSLRTLQYVRSSSVAHSKSSNYKTNLTNKLDLPEFSFAGVHKSLISSLNTSMSILKEKVEFVADLANEQP